MSKFSSDKVSGGDNEIRCWRSDWTKEIVPQLCFQGRGIGNMPTAEAIGGSCTVPPRGGGHNKLNRASVPASRAASAAGLRLPGVVAVAVVRGPGGVTPDFVSSCWAWAWWGCGNASVAHNSQGRTSRTCELFLFASAAVALALAQRQIERYHPGD